MFKELNPILHSQLRLAIMSILLTVEEAEFVYLKEKTQSTAGNLSVQLDKLSEAGYIVVEKSFAGGQLRILFGLPDGQTITASRYGIDNDLQPGQKVKIGWDAKDAVKVIDNDKDENHK